MHYDVIVIGTGGVGAAAVYHLASRGARVLGLDRFPGGHDRGSSHGKTRIIRQAYFEHPDYVPLLRRAYALWADLEAECGERLFRQVGLLQVGPPDGVVAPGVLRSAREHQLEVDAMTAAEAARAFPGFRPPDDAVAVFERRAGFLHVEACVLRHLDGAARRGAELRFDEPAVRWSADARGDGVVVETARGRYEAKRLVVAAGAWAGPLLADLGVPFQVRRKHLHWYPAPPAVYSADSSCPTYLFELPDGIYYGFPAIDDQGIKVGEHSGGAVVADPLNDDRSLEPDDRRRVESFLERAMPGVVRQASGHAVCYYTMTRDEHFVVDRLPGRPQVALAAGLSGHGFKFTSVLGQTLADLTLDGATSLPIEFLAASRPAARS